MENKEEKIVVFTVSEINKIIEGLGNIQYRDADPIIRFISGIAGKQLNQNPAVVPEVK